MDYKEKYEMVLEKIRAIYNKIIFSARIEDAKLTEKLEEIFPELKSEDERTRKNIISFLRSKNGYMNPDEDWDFHNRWLPWLEKQGKEQSAIVWHSIDDKPEEMRELFCEWESNDATWHEVAFYHSNNKTFWNGELQVENVVRWCYIDDLLEKQEPIDREKVLIGARKDVALSIMNHLDNNTQGMCLSNMECEDLENAVVNSNWDKVYRYMKKKLEGQSELKTPNIDGIEFKIGDAISVYGNPLDYEHATITQKDYTSKVEPKFKIGDWIIRNAEGFKHNTYLVTEVKDYYVCEELKGRRVTFTFNDVHKNFKLWDISDAKDGDVLVCNEEILLFKSYSVQGRISLYCWYNGQTDNFHSKEVADTLLTTRDKICPATKEQRDLLFKKMKEVGYEWDDSTKELKKINSYCIENCKGYQETGKCFTDGECDTKRKAEQKSSAWSEKDDRIYYNLLADIKTRQKNSTNTLKEYYNKQINWLNSFKRRVQPKQEWNEEDEKMIQSLIQNQEFLIDSTINEQLRDMYAKEVDWLKSLYNNLKKLKKK